MTELLLDYIDSLKNKKIIVLYYYIKGDFIMKHLGNNFRSSRARSSRSFNEGRFDPEVEDFAKRMINTIRRNTEDTLGSNSEFSSPPGYFFNKAIKDFVYDVTECMRVLNKDPRYDLQPTTKPVVWE